MHKQPKLLLGLKIYVLVLEFCFFSFPSTFYVV